MSPRLKLIALDGDDLPVISAHCQDAVLKSADMRFLARERRFVLAMNRFVWELADDPRHSFQRRRAVLHFERVDRVRTRGLQPQKRDEVLNLLAVTFEPGPELPAGTVTLTFAGGGAVQLDVECLEARLSDLAAAWETAARPSHALDPDAPGRAG